MAGFGDDLRLERERRGVSLDGLSAQTKVNPRYLEALEQGNFHELPGGVFRRGIFRSYLAALGLEESEWLPRFETSVAENSRMRGESNLSGEEAWYQFASNVKRNRIQQRRSALGRWAGVGAMLLLLGVALYALWILELRGLMAH
jgi:cytoskeletal protein RodZ